jgi:hypothetical protein
LERSWRSEVFGEHQRASQLTLDRKRSWFTEHKRMKAMFKKLLIHAQSRARARERRRTSLQAPLQTPNHNTLERTDTGRR